MTLEFAKQTESEASIRAERYAGVAGSYVTNCGMSLMKDEAKSKNVSLHSRWFKRSIELEKSLLSTLFSFEGARCVEIASHLNCATAQYH